MHINKETAGYELLRRAIVIWEIEGNEISEKALKGLKENVTQSQKNKLVEKELLRRVRESADMQIGKDKVIKSSRTAEEQAIIESIRAVSDYGVKISILDFVKEVVENIF